MTGNPVNLGQLRQAVREFCNLDPNDPTWSDAAINRAVNAAFHRFQVANPHGWSYDYRDPPAATGGIFLGATDHVDFEFDPTPVHSYNPSSANAMRVRWVIALDPAGQWQYPLERVTREEMLRRFPKDSETGAPRVFCILGSPAEGNGITVPLARMWVRPVGDQQYFLLFGGRAPLVDMQADTDPNPNASQRDNQIAQYSDLIVAYASYLVMRGKKDFGEAILAAKSYFDAGVMSLRRVDRRKVGAGFGQNPVNDERDLAT